MKKIILIAICLWSFSAFSQGYLKSKSFNKKENFFERTRSIVPASKSLLKYASYPHLQAGGTCVNHAVAQGMNILFAQHRKSTNKQENSIYSFSPYYNYISNVDDFEEGMYIKDCLESVKNIGIPLIGNSEFLNYYPFSQDTLQSISKLPVNTNKKLIQNAANFKLKKWEKVNNIDALKESISRGFPVVIGVDHMLGVGLDYFITYCDTDTCLWSIDKSVRDIFYKHAVLVTGYDDKIQAVEVLNSWGANWGNNGVFWMKYEDVFPLVSTIDIEISKIDSPLDEKMLYYEDENYEKNEDYCWLNIGNGKCYSQDKIFEVDQSNINEWTQAYNKFFKTTILEAKEYGFCSVAYSMQGIDISSQVIFIDDVFMKNISDNKKFEDFSELNNSRWYKIFKDFLKE